MFAVFKPSIKSLFSFLKSIYKPTSRYEVTKHTFDPHPCQAFIDELRNFKTKQEADNKARDEREKALTDRVEVVENADAVEKLVINTCSELLLHAIQIQPKKNVRPSTYLTRRS